MAGKPISHRYIRRIADYGIGRIFERVENGETLKSVAASLGMSRGWLSTYVNQDPHSARTLALCRAVAAYRRLAAGVKVDKPGQAPQHAVDCLKAHEELYLGSANLPALHLEALKRAQDGLRADAGGAARIDSSAVTPSFFGASPAKPPGESR